MQCIPYNVSDFEVSVTDQMVETLKHYEGILWTRVAIALCCFGVLGNILNLFVLTRRSLVSRMGSMEKSSTAGLVALAISDLFFCFCNIPNVALSQSNEISFSTYYRLYHIAVTNIFVVSSTWLTVVMAFSRYLAICRPLHARLIVDMRFAKASLVAVFVGSVLINLPRFWHHKLNCYELTKEAREEWPTSDPIWNTIGNGALGAGTVGWKAYTITYFVLAVVIPLIMLAFCNVYLVRALRESSRMRSQYTRRQTESDQTRVVTLTLTVIVLANIALVAPCEIFTFITHMLQGEVTDRKQAVINLVVTVLNVLQVVNFSFNFVLYILINAHFRRAIMEVFRCSSQTERRRSRNSELHSEAVSMTQQTTVPMTLINNGHNKVDV